MDEITIVPYDRKWSEYFEQEAQILRKALADENPIIEHIGSTSIIGLDAKPTVDSMIGFQILRSDKIIEKIEALGYEHWKEDQFQHERLFFTKWDSDKKKRLIHIHATIIGNSFWTNQIAFRNVLQAHPEVATEYSALKKELAFRFKNDRDGYTAAKMNFLRKVLAR